MTARADGGVAGPRKHLVGASPRRVEGEMGFSCRRQHGRGSTRRSDLYCEPTERVIGPCALDLSEVASAAYGVVGRHYPAVRIVIRARGDIRWRSPAIVLDLLDEAPCVVEDVLRDGVVRRRLRR